jgi:anaerobic selenocysteine-containing dehydrogenase
MDKHQHDAQPPSGRRKFLRQLGTTAVATAALSGLADVVGLKPAAAATRAEGGMKVRGARNRASVVPDATVTSVSVICQHCNGCCGSPCTPSGLYCHFCWGQTILSSNPGIPIIGFEGYYCIGGGNNFTLT